MSQASAAETGRPMERSTRGPRPDRDNRLVILEEIALALNSTLDPRKLLDLLLDSSIRYSGATTGSVMLIREDRLDIVASRGLGANVDKEVRLEVGEGITGWVAKAGQPLIVPDVARDERYVQIKEHINSELAVPMIRNNKVMGVISVDSSRKDNFSGDDLEILSFVGSQAAQILENAQAFDELQRKNKRDETLLEISTALGSALDLGELFRQVMEILSRRWGMHRGCLVLTQPESDELSIVYAHGLTPEEMAKGRYQKGEGIIGRVFKTKKSAGVKDIRKEPRFVGKTGAFVGEDQQLSFLATPILLEGKAVGVFGVVTVFPGGEEFDADIALLQIIAGTLSQAVKIYQDAAREKARLVRENELLREELRTRSNYRFDNIVGSSAAMQEVFHTVVSVAPSRSTVLIRGESGTGKELIANAIHYSSPRADRPFVRVNCAAIPEQLLEAELFGHVKGSFTGAVADRKGKFVLADGGTIFLDEIGDMTRVLQSKILRVLQEREVDVVGSDRPVKVDVRIIAATHRPLEELVETGEFREDLYYRLNVVPIQVPPLRERLEDIRTLVQHFLEKLSRENDMLPRKISPDALRKLMRYEWPGNVREVENVIERAAIMCDGEVIRASDIPSLGGPLRPSGPAANGGSLEDAVQRDLEAVLENGAGGDVWDCAMARVERALIQQALERCGGVRLKAAEFLGIHRNTLRKKIDELGLGGR